MLLCGIVGFAPGVVFLVLLFVARLQLGDAFSIAPEAGNLVTTGVYSKVRHPVYVFGTLAILGVVLYEHLWPALLAFLVLVPMQILRARAEEKVPIEKSATNPSATKAGRGFEADPSRLCASVPLWQAVLARDSGHLL